MLKIHFLNFVVLGQLHESIVRPRELENEEAVMSRWTMKSVVLHNLPMNMKGALKANQVKLEKANFFLLYLLDSKLFKKCLCRSSQPVCEHLFNEDKKKQRLMAERLISQLKV